MKRLAFFVISILVALNMYAQSPSVIDYNSHFSGPATWKELYNHFRGIDGVTTVYVSEAMFRLARRIPEINVDAGDGDLDLAPIISSLKYLYVINIPSDCQVEVRFKGLAKNQSLREVMERLYNSYSEYGKLEPYLEVNQGKEEQVRVNAKTVGNVITTFAMFVNEGDESTLVYIEGEIPQKDLEDALGKVVR